MGLGGWRDAAIVLLVLESFVGVLIVGAAFYFCVRGVLWLKTQIPTVTRPATAWLAKAEGTTRRATDSATTPFIWTGASAARVKALVRTIVRTDRRNTHA